MANYRIALKASAAREIEDLGSKRDRQRLVDAIRALAANPRPLGSIKLTGQVSTYRIRVGRYRIVYSIEDEVLLVYVITVAHRKDVYR